MVVVVERYDFNRSSAKVVDFKGVSCSTDTGRQSYCIGGSGPATALTVRSENSMGGLPMLGVG